MQLKYRLPFVILATAAVAMSSLRAQDDDDDEEEFGSFGFYARSPQAIKVNLNLTQAPQVQFGNLGNVPVTFDHTSPGVTTRVYMDGTVGDDALRPYNASNPAYSELDSEKHRLYPSGGRYKTYTTPGDTSSAVATDYLGYQEGYTRNWSYTNASQSQSKPGYIAFNIYSAQTQGETALGSRGYTGGIELSLAHSLTDSKKRVSLSLTAGLTLTGINSSKTGQVTSTLHTYTDYYLYQPQVPYSGAGAPVLPNNADGTVANPIYTGPSFTTVDGLTTETTTPLSTTHLHADDPNGDEEVEVDGVWKIKGAYFTLKVGPEINAMLTRSLGVRASVGLAGSYVGTTYSASENFTVDGVETPIGTGGTGEQTASTKKFLPGYYANIDATWAINDRTGFFAGVSYDNLGDYSQTLAGRTAKIDLSSTAGVRGGLSIKF